MREACLVSPVSTGGVVSSGFPVGFLWPDLWQILARFPVGREMALAADFFAFWLRET